jgi:uncharacterized membrane protein
MLMGVFQKLGNERNIMPVSRLSAYVGAFLHQCISTFFLIMTCMRIFRSQISLDIQWYYMPLAVCVVLS